MIHVKIIKIIIKIIWKLATIFGMIMGTIYGIDYFANKDYKKEKELTVYTYDVQKLLNNHLSDNVKILYQDKVVNNLYSKSFTIKNTGKKEVDPTDYVENICIEIDDNTILDAQLVSYKNKYIQKNIINNTSIGENRTCFPNILLNSDDYYQINIITNKNPRVFRITGVVSGIAKINLNNSNTAQYKISTSRKVFAVIVTIGFPVVLALSLQLLISELLHRRRIKKFMEIFKCDKWTSELLSTYYFKKIDTIEKNSNNIDKEKKELKKEIKKYIIETKSDMMIKS